MNACDGTWDGTWTRACGDTWDDTSTRATLVYCADFEPQPVPRPNQQPQTD